MGVTPKIHLLLLLLLLPVVVFSQDSNVENNALETAFQMALSFYPELRDVNIRVKYGRIKTSMAAMPRTRSLLFNKRAKRSYSIIVNKREKRDAARLVHNSPFEAQVGIFGHELAHILDYTQKTNCQMIGFAISYLNREKRRQTERKIDSLTIAHNLGWELYRFTHFLFNEANISPKYRNFKTKYYLPPDSLYRMIVRREGEEGVHPKEE